MRLARVMARERRRCVSDRSDIQVGPNTKSLELAMAT
jgi:hypothetical protein